MATANDPCGGISDPLQELVCRLRYATELEQQFMCMYLYGVFSIRKRYVEGQHFPDLTPAQLEMSRRWASTVYTVARQEMEHLAIANNLLRSVGAAPCFSRTNLNQGPLRHFHLGAPPSIEVATSGQGAASGNGQSICDNLEPITQDFAFIPFDLEAVKRWTCMESPDCQTLAQNDAQNFAFWCFRETGEGPAPVPDEQAEAVSPGTITCWYDKIADLFQQLSNRAFVTPAGLFGISRGPWRFITQ